LTAKGEETGEVGKNRKNCSDLTPNLTPKLGQGLIVADQPFSFFRRSIKMRNGHRILSFAPLLESIEDPLPLLHSVFRLPADGTLLHPGPPPRLQPFRQRTPPLCIAADPSP